MLLQFPNLGSFSDLTHAVTTRCFQSDDDFNLSNYVGTNSQHAIRNRRRLCERLGLNFDRLTTARQIHGAGVSIVDENRCASEIPDTDAMITNLPDTPLMVLSADCPLVIIYDDSRKALGLVHASWRSLFKGIIPATINTFSKIFDSAPENILAGIGPGAGSCCYQVDKKFTETISSKPELLSFIIDRNSEMFFDLRSAIFAELTHSQIDSKHIEMINRCTICDENFFSYRRQGNKAGRFALIAAIHKSF